MKELAFLEYTFMFDPGETWSHLSQFEGALADFFSAYDMEVQVVKTAGGQVGRRIMLISKVKSRAEKAVEPREEKPLGKKISSMIKSDPQRSAKKSSTPFISRGALADKKKRSLGAGADNPSKTKRIQKVGFRKMVQDDDVY